MELIIPGWAVILISGGGSLFLAWMVWLTLRTNENDKSIAVNTANDRAVAVELDKLQKSIDRLDSKMDTFLHQEIMFFKEHFKK